MANPKNRKKKIMLVANTLLHHQSFNMFLAEQCTQSGYQVIFVANLREKNSTSIPKQVKLIHWAVDRGNTKILREIQSFQALKKIIREENPDIIHAFTIKANIYSSIAGKFFSQAKLINTVTGLGQTFIDRRLKTLLVRMITKIFWYWALNLSDSVIFINHDDVKLFRTYVFHPKISVIPGHGFNLNTLSKSTVDQKKLKSLSKLLCINKNELLVVTIGRLIEQKGILEFFQAAEILKEQNHNLRFLIIGLDDNQNPSKINDTTLKAIKDSGITILRNRDDVREILSLADIFVLASYREGLPQSIIEAQAMGVSTVTTDVPGCRELIRNNYNGYLVPKKDYQRLFLAIDKLIKKPNKRKLFSERGAKIVNRTLDQRKIIRKILRIYNGLLNEI